MALAVALVLFAVFASAITLQTISIKINFAGSDAEQAGDAVITEVTFPTPEPTPVATEIPTAEPTIEPTPTAEPTPCPTPEMTPSPTPEVTPSPTETPTPEATPTEEPTPCPTPEITPSPTETPTPTPEVTVTPTPTEEPTSTPTVTPSPTPTEEPDDKNVTAKKEKKKKKAKAAYAVDRAGNKVAENIDSTEEADGTYRIKLKPNNGPVKFMDFQGVDVESMPDAFVRIDDAPNSTAGENGFSRLYAIDPSAANFTTATVTVTAQENALYKCREWDFDARRCNGEWAFVGGIIPGRDYNLTLTPDDPAYGENSTYFTLTNITVDGVFRDWDAVMANSHNVISDGLRGVDDPDTPDIGQANRDVLFFAFTWNATDLFLYYRRAVVGATQVAMLLYVDPSLDGYMNNSEPIVRLAWTGSSGTVSRSVDNYSVDATPSQNLMLGDGHRINGTIGTTVTLSNQPGGNTNISDAMYRLEVEASIPWANLSMVPGSPFKFQAASGQGSANNLPSQVNDNMNVSTTLEADIAVSAGTNKGAAAGTNVTFNHTVTNNGNKNDTVNIYLTSLQGWNLTATFANGTPLTDTTGDSVVDTGRITPGGSTNIVVVVSVPSNTTTGTVDTITVNGTSTVMPAVSSVATDMLAVGAITIVPTQQGKVINSTVVSYNHTITNTQAFSDIVKLNATSNNSWNIALYYANGTAWSDTNLSAGASVNITVRTTIPAVAPGTMDLTTVRVNSTVNASLQVNANDTTTIAAKRLEITPSYQGVAGRGSYIFYDHQVCNYWNQTDTANLTCTSSNSSWTCAFYNSVKTTQINNTGTLAAAGGCINVSVKVVAPSNVAVNTTVNQTLRAISTSTAGVNDTVNDSTTARILITYNNSARTEDSMTDLFYRNTVVYAKAWGVTGASINITWYYPNATTANSSGRTVVGGSALDQYDLGSSAPYGDWFIVAYNSTGGALDQVHFHVNDITPPQWTNLTQNSSTINMGASVNLSAYWTDDANLSYAILSTNESGVWQNKTVYGSPMDLSDLNASWSNFTWNNASFFGTLAWKIWANDTSDNWNVTNQMNVTVRETLAPTYSSDADDSGGGVVNGTIVNVSVYWQDLATLDKGIFRSNQSGAWANVSTCALSGSAGWCNASMNTSGNASMTICWNEYANDTYGNLNASMPQATHCFNVVSTDVTLPSIALNYPAAGFATSSTTINFNWTATDNLAASMNCNLTINSTINATNVASPNATATNYSVVGLAQGLWFWNVTCRDTANNSNTSATRNFTVNTAVPSVSIYLPANTTYNSTPVALNYSVSGANIDSCWYYVNGTGPTALPACANSTIPLGQGYFNVTVYVNNTGGNTNSSSSFFTLDLSLPSISLNSPAAGFFTNLTSVNFNWTATDSQSSSMNCSLAINSAVNASNLTSANATPTNYSVSGFAQGAYFWNVTCLDNASNSNTSATRNFTVDTTLPSITIFSPANTTYNTTSISLNFTVNDTNPGSCWYYVNGTGPTALPSCANATVPLSQGVFNLTVYANDSAGNTNSSSVYFTIDTTLPSVALNYPPAGFASNSTTINFNWTATDNLAASMNCNLTLNSTVNATNVPSTNNTPTNYSVAGLAQGVWFWNVTCQDNDTNFNTSATRNVTVDTVAPTVSIQSPANTTYNTSSVNLNFSASDTNRGSCWYYLNGSGPTALPNCANTTLSPGSGYFNLTVYANDTAGNTNSSTVYFTIDTALPSVALNYPTAGFFTNLTAVNFNWTATDSQSSSMNCSLTINSAVNASNLTSANNTPTNYSVSGFAQGTYFWNVTCHDNASNSNTSATRNFTVDTTKPSVTIFSPANTTYNTTSISLNFTVNDTNPGSCWYYVNGTGPTALPNCANATVPLSQGVFNLTVYANDTAGNTNSSSVYFTIDTTPPSIFVSSPVNGTSYNGTVYLNYTAVDPRLNATWFVLNGVANYTQGNVSLGPLLQGWNNVTVYANDSAGNQNNSQIIYFFFDNAVPQIDFTAGTNASGFYKSNQTVNFSVTDANISTVRVYVNGSVANTCNGPATALSCAVNLTAEGNYSVYGWANDSSANTNQTLPRNYTIDKTAPSLVVTSPVNNSAYNSTVYLNYSAFDPYLNTTWFVLNGGSPNYTLGNVSLGPLLQGWNNVTVYANDSAGNLNSTFLRFFFDNQSPQLDFAANMNASGFYNGAVLANFTVSDANLTNVTIYVNGTAAKTCSGNTTTYCNTTISAQGSYNVSATAFDGAGNSNSTANRTYVIDLTLPQIFVSSPTNGTAYAVAPSLNYTAVDTYLNATWFVLNGVPNYTQGNVTLVPVQGWNNVTVYANDTAGNQNNSQVIYFFFDNAPPQIDFTPATNASGFYNSPQIVNFTATDANLTSVKVYVNGALNTTCNGPATALSCNVTLVWNGNFSVYANATDNSGNYNFTSARNYTMDFVKPQISVTSPVNNSAYNSTVYLNYSASDLYLNTTWFVLNGGSPNYTAGNVTLGPLVQGWNNVTVYANDSAGNLNSTFLQFFFDNAPPQIDFKAGTNATGYYNGTQIVNFTATDANMSSMRVYVNGALNTTCYGSGPSLYCAVTLNAAGNFSVYGWANDTGANTNQTLPRNYTIDLTPPSLVVTSPLNNTAYNGTVYLNYSVADQYLQSFWYVFNGGAPVYAANVTLSPVQGWNNVTVYVNDSAGNLNSSYLTFFFDNQTPQIDFAANANASGFYNGSINANFTVSDANLSIVIIYVNGSAAKNCTGNTTTSCNFTISAAGSYNVSATALDGIGYSNATANRTYIIDLTVPQITITSPTNATWYNTSTVNYSVQIVEPYLNATWFVLDGGAANYSANVTLVLADGTHNITAYANDSAGNSNQSSLRVFYVDTAAPNITITVPANTTYAATWVWVNATTSENASLCRYSLDGAANQTMNASSNTSWYYNASPIADGPHTVTIYCNDSAGNLGSNTSYFSVDTTPPTISNVQAVNITVGSAVITWDTNKASNSTVGYNTTVALGINVSNATAVLTGHTVPLSGLTPNTLYYFNVTSCDFTGCRTAGPYNFTTTLAFVQITSTSLSPYAMVNSSNATLSMSAINFQTLWATITKPDASQQNVSLLNNTNGTFTNTSLVGRYNVTFFANDSSGLIVNATNYFESFAPFVLNFTVINYSLITGENSTWTAYYRGQVIDANSSQIGNYSAQIANAVLDLEFTAYSGRLRMLLRDINVSQCNNLAFGMDKLPAPLNSQLITYGLNNSCNFTNATITLYYDNTAFTSASALKFEKCSDWNFSTETCGAGGWLDITSLSTNNVAGGYFTYFTTSFSGFGVKQPSSPAPASTPGPGGASYPIPQPVHPTEVAPTPTEAPTAAPTATPAPTVRPMPSASPTPTASLQPMPGGQAKAGLEAWHLFVALIIALLALFLFVGRGYTVYFDPREVSPSKICLPSETMKKLGILEGEHVTVSVGGRKAHAIAAHAPRALTDSRSHARGRGRYAAVGEKVLHDLHIKPEKKRDTKGAGFDSFNSHVPLKIEKTEDVHQRIKHLLA